MRVFKHKIDEKKRPPFKKDVWYHVRRFLHLYTDDEKDIFDGHLEIIVKKPVFEFGWLLKVGNIGSETPFDGHVKLFGSAVYWGISSGRKLAQKITETKKERFSSRELSLSIFSGRLWVRGWVPSNDYEKGKYAKWRTASLELNPLNHILGRPQYTYEDLDTAETLVELDDGDYPVTLKLQKVMYGRPKGKKRLYEYSIDVDSQDGIPVYNRNSWKGDSVYGFGVKAPYVFDKKSWVNSAQLAVKSWIYAERSRNNWSVKSQE